MPLVMFSPQLAIFCLRVLLRNAWILGLEAPPPVISPKRWPLWKIARFCKNSPDPLNCTSSTTLFSSRLADNLAEQCPFSTSKVNLSQIALAIWLSEVRNLHNEGARWVTKYCEWTRKSSVSFFDCDLPWAKPTIMKTVFRVDNESSQQSKNLPFTFQFLGQVTRKR